MQKKSQVTIYMILALFIIIVFIVAFYIVSLQTESSTKQQASDARSIEPYIENCMKMSLDKGIVEVGYSDLSVLEDYVNTRTKLCANISSLNRDITELANPSSKINLSNNNVSLIVKLNYPIITKEGSKESKTSSFYVNYPLTSATNLQISGGITTAQSTVYSRNRNAILTIPAGVQTSTDSISVELEDVTSLGGDLISPIAYNFGPDGTTFNPPILLTVTYDEENIPEGISENDLKITYYDSTTSSWVSLASTVDTANNIISAYVSHFTEFAVAYDETACSLPVTFISDQLEHVQSADPYIMKKGNKYYLYLTGGDNIPIYTSSNFSKWTYVGNAFSSNNISMAGKLDWQSLQPTTYTYRDMWAPEIIQRGRYYILGLAARQSTAEESTIWLAWGNTSTGPFGPYNGTRMHEPVAIRNNRTTYNTTAGQPQWTSTNDNGIEYIRIDPHFFVDDDGSVWLFYVYYNSSNSIGAVKLDTEDLSFTNSSSPESFPVIIAADQTIGETCYYYNSKTGDDYVQSTCIAEGPEIIKHNGKYILFYSVNAYNANSYSILYKMANSVRCLAVDQTSNASCSIRTGIAFAGKASTNYSYGHGGLFTGLDGERIFHAITVMKDSTDKSYRKIWVVEQKFNSDGTPSTLMPNETDKVFIGKRCGTYNIPSGTESISFYLENAYQAQGNSDGYGYCASKGLRCYSVEWLNRNNQWASAESDGGLWKVYNCQNDDLNNQLYNGVARIVNCYGYTNETYSNKVNYYAMEKINDSGGFNYTSYFCANKGLTARGTDWIYPMGDTSKYLCNYGAKNSATDNVGRWCEFGTDDSLRMHYNSSEGYLNESYYDGSGKLAYCVGIKNASVNNTNLVKKYYLSDYEDAEEMDAERFCNSKGMDCIGVDWVYQSNCSNYGWCTIDELEQGKQRADIRHYSCSDEIGGQEWDGSIKAVYCKRRAYNSTNASVVSSFAIFSNIQTANANSGKEYCALRNMKCLSVYWLNYNNAQWIGFNSDEGLWKAYSCSNTELNNTAYSGVAKIINCYGGSTVEDRDQVHFFGLKTISDSNGYNYSSEHCANRSLYGFGIDWVYSYYNNSASSYYCRQSRNADSIGQRKYWCEFNIDAGVWQHFGIKNGYLNDTYYENTAKLVYCSGNISNISNDNNYVNRYAMTITADTNDMDANEFCSSKGMECLGVDWLYKQGCSNQNWCTLEDLDNGYGGADVYHYSCSDEIKREDWDGSLKIVYCKGDIERSTSSFTIIQASAASGSGIITVGDATSGSSLTVDNSLTV